VLFRVVTLGLIPLVVSVIYVRAWPGVASRPMLTGALGVLVGITAALAALVWSVWPALTNVGISGGTQTGPTLAELTSSRAVWAYLFAMVASILGVWFVAKHVGTPEVATVSQGEGR
jgi:hypothetical protein